MIMYISDPTPCPSSPQVEPGHANVHMVRSGRTRQGVLDCELTRYGKPNAMQRESTAADSGDRQDGHIQYLKHGTSLITC